tara:strand:+ start:504 stop:854 length:351 start_codon:yes stop_codon:yes gene_type:complete
MHEYAVKLDRVVDGDTVDVMVDLGFKIWVKKRIRYYGINTPESRTRDKVEKAKGIAAKIRNKEILEGATKIRCQSLGVGKYGRILGILYVDDNSESVQDQLIRENHGVKYYGGKRK